DHAYSLSDDCCHEDYCASWESIRNPPSAAQESLPRVETLSSSPRSESSLPTRSEARSRWRRKRSVTFQAHPLRFVHSDASLSRPQKTLAPSGPNQTRSKEPALADPPRPSGLAVGWRQIAPR